MRATHIRQLSKKEQLKYYKAIKAALLSEGVYSYENIKEAMDQKIADVDGLI